jgi:hypothetical protein
MSDQETRGAGAGADAGAGVDAAGRVDEDGLPIDRPATLDDVRGTEGSGRSIAFGCTAIVALAVLLFWLLRAGLFG